MPNLRDPFKNPATRKQKWQLAAICLAMVFSAYSALLVALIYADVILQIKAVLPSLCAILVAQFGLTSWLYCRIRTDILGQDDQTVLVSGETIREHDLKAWRQAMTAHILHWSLTSGFLLFAYIIYPEPTTSESTLGIDSCLLGVLATHIPCNIFFPFLMPVVRLYICKTEPVGEFERPFWKPPTLGARWRRWRDRRDVDVEVAEHEDQVPLLSENDEKMPI